MKIKPVILCGGAGTRLWKKSKENLPKQFIDFGGWTLLQKVLERINNPIFDYPIISTNLMYLNLAVKYLAKYKVKKYKIILEPSKKNTAAAILSSAILDEIPFDQPMIFLPADHLIEKPNIFAKSIKNNFSHLDEENIFIFGIKPKSPSSQYGYILTKKIGNGINKVIRFIEKPNTKYAKKIIKSEGLWNSGIVFARKDSIINNFIKHQPKILDLCIKSVSRSKLSKNIFFLDKNSFKKIKEISFDHAILEKAKNINAIKLNISWFDLGNWREISNIFKIRKNKYLKKKNIFYRPWGKYTNLFNGKGFLIKELVINPRSSISLQKHKFRAEHWTVVSGNPLITINRKKFIKKINETILVPKGATHRIENPNNIPVVIMEVQKGSILKESDIVRYKDIYGRVK